MLSWPAALLSPILFIQLSAGLPRSPPSLAFALRTIAGIAACVVVGWLITFVIAFPSLCVLLIGLLLFAAFWAQAGGRAGLAPFVLMRAAGARHRGARGGHADRRRAGQGQRGRLSGDLGDLGPLSRSAHASDGRRVPEDTARERHVIAGNRRPQPGADCAEQHARRDARGCWYFWCSSSAVPP